MEKHLWAGSITWNLLNNSDRNFGFFILCTKCFRPYDQDHGHDPTFCSHTLYVTAGLKINLNSRPSQIRIYTVPNVKSSMPKYHGNIAHNVLYNLVAFSLSRFVLTMDFHCPKVNFYSHWDGVNFEHCIWTQMFGSLKIWAALCMSRKRRTMTESVAVSFYREKKTVVEYLTSVKSTAGQRNI